ncbi:C40 family peptidase [Streptomyces sp. NPDC059443]|uniref:C40 family peptidase n=1 Tax=Streptomyces sp. NPDC059443 TaxID=3346831 RepID=UPI00367BD368
MAGQYARYASMASPMSPGGGSFAGNAQRMWQESNRFGVVRNGASVAELGQARMGMLGQYSYDANAANRAMGALNPMLTANPNLGPMASARATAQFGSPQAFWAGQMYGVDTLQRGGRGAQVNPLEVGQQFFKNSLRPGINSNSLSQAQINASFGPRSGYTQSWLAAARDMGIDPEIATAISNTNQTTMQLSAASGGKYTQDQARSLLEQSAKTSAPAGSAEYKQAQKARTELARLNKGLGSPIDLKEAGQNLELSQESSSVGATLTAQKNSLSELVKIREGFDPLFKILKKGEGALKGFQSGGGLGMAGSLLENPVTGPGLVGMGTAVGGPGFGGLLAAGRTMLQGMLGGATVPKQPGQGEGGKEAGPSLPSANTGSILDFARNQLGDRYEMGAEGPDVWDCSSLVQAAYKSAGINLPRVTYDQVKEGAEVPMDQLQPGDLVFYKDNSHVGLFAGGKSVIEAANPGVGVVERPWLGLFDHARRIVNGSVKATKDLSGKSKDPTKSWAGGGGGFGGSREADVLAALFSGGGGAGTAQVGSRTPQSTQNEEAKNPSRGKDTVSDTRANVELGRKLAASYGWNGPEFDALYKLWMGESNWDANALNDSSGAYGIPQILPSAHGHPVAMGDAEGQIKWGLDYIKGREDYGSPSKAYQKWLSRDPHWYAAGAWKIPGDQDARLHAGEMVLDSGQAETVRQAISGMNSPVGGGSAVSPTINFGPVTINMPAATQEGAKSAAEQFVASVAADQRIKTMLGGW